MRRLLPSRIELMIFAALAVVLAGIVTQIQPARHDLGTAALVVPTFIFAAVLGLRRSPLWMKAQEVETDTIDEG